MNQKNQKSKLIKKKKNKAQKKKQIVPQQQLQEEEVEVNEVESEHENANELSENKEQIDQIRNEIKSELIFEEPEEEKDNGSNQVLVSEDINDKKKVYVILEQACVKVCRIKGKDELINSDNHKNYISKVLNQTYSDFRPDILHQSLLVLLDSPLNKAGLLQVYIHTAENVLIYVNPALKIPRTYQRFANLIVQLMTKYKIRAVEENTTLLKIIKNPVSNYIPLNSKIIGTSSKARLVKINEFIKELPQNEPVVFVVGAVAVGNAGVENDYINDSISVSRYNLTAACCLSKMVNGFEDLWNIH